LKEYDRGILANARFHGDVVFTDRIDVEIHVQAQDFLHVAAVKKALDDLRDSILTVIQQKGRRHDYQILQQLLDNRNRKIIELPDYRVDWKSSVSEEQARHLPVQHEKDP
jgi:hypothetical protein